MSDKKFYVTTPIYYVNARPHIGHAYTTIVADVLARRHRLLGDDTFFLTGTDEHGQKIERSAAAAGIAPQQFADQVSKSFEDLWKRMGITNNDYIRTTSDKHKRGVQHLFSELYKNGFIYLASYTGSYCVSDETFVDAPVGTPCPDCGRLLEEVTEENFFFKLSAFQRPLLDLIESDTIAITPDSRKNEVLSFLRGNLSPSPSPGAPSSTAAFGGQGGVSSEARPLSPALATSAAGHPYLPGALKDLSISRSSFTWGIPVPEPAASAAAQKHVIYVWLDALANYMTAIGYGSDDPAEQAKFQKYWPADLHLVGKEIIRFHCVYWPAFLLALNPEGTRTPAKPDTPGAPGPASGTRVSTETQGPQLTFDQHKAWAEKWLPQAITAHGWLLFEDSKMSKSRGNIVRTETILDAFGTLCPPPLLSFRSAAEESASPVPATDRVPQGFSLGSPSDEIRVPQGFSLGSPLDEKNGGALAPEGISPAPTQHDRDLFASDVLRYFLLREIPFGQDGSFSFDALITRYNADLANGYGNLVSRTLKMVSDYFDGVIPLPQPMRPLDRTVLPEWWTSDPLATQAKFLEEFQPDPFLKYGYISIRDVNGQVGLSLDSELVVHGGKYFYPVNQGLNTWEFFQVAVDPLLRLANTSSWEKNLTRTAEFIAAQVKVVDEFLSLSKPWKLPAEDTRRTHILGVAVEYIRIITILLHPILPYATTRVWQQLGLDKTQLITENGELTTLTWGGLKPGTKLGPLGPIFPRADKGLAQIMTDMENPTPADITPADPAADPRTTAIPAPATPPAPLTTENGELTTPQITIDDFAKIELRVAQILVAERIPKADKLLRLEVDLGPHGKRQILSGIAEFYTPEELIGRRIVVITNLAPRKMRGLESHGMLLAASDPEAGDHGKPHLATCGDDIALGSRLK
jgi:methionyl-tRNA synthetase